jgi:hypothetical protein
MMASFQTRQAPNMVEAVRMMDPFRQGKHQIWWKVSECGYHSDKASSIYGGSCLNDGLIQTRQVQIWWKVSECRSHSDKASSNMAEAVRMQVSFRQGKLQIWWKVSECGYHSDKASPKYVNAVRMLASYLLFSKKIGYFFPFLGKRK